MKKWPLLLLFLLPSCYKDRFTAVAKESLPKTVMISVETVVPLTTVSFDGKKLQVSQSTETIMLRGAGVFISPNGHILTAAHLGWIGKVKNITIKTYKSQEFKAEKLYEKDIYDLALYKISASSPTPFAALAPLGKLDVGNEVVAIGNPRGLPFSVSHGIISRLGTHEAGFNMTQSDCFINPGNSGGPLFNLDGELVGINSRIISGAEYDSVFSGLGFSSSPESIYLFISTFTGINWGLYGN